MYENDRVTSCRYYEVEMQASDNGEFLKTYIFAYLSPFTDIYVTFVLHLRSLHVIGTL